MITHKGMTPRQILVEARKLISEESKWTQGTVARRLSSGGLLFPCTAKNANACMWCLDGELIAVVPPNLTENDIYSRRAVEHTLNQLAGPDGYVEFNDCRTHAEVLALLDQAIERFPE